MLIWLRPNGWAMKRNLKDWSGNVVKPTGNADRFFRRWNQWERLSDGYRIRFISCFPKACYRNRERERRDRRLKVRDSIPSLPGSLRSLAWVSELKALNDSLPIDNHRCNL